MMESYQTQGQCKAGAPVPKEYDTLIAQLQSQLTTSLQSLQRHHNPRLNQTGDEEQGQPQLLKQEQQRSREIRLDQWPWLSQEHQPSQEPRPSQEQWLSQTLQMGLAQPLNQERHLNQKQQLNQERELSLGQRLCQERQLNPERELSLEQCLCQERRLGQHQRLSQALSLMPAVMTRMATQDKEFRTFDDAAFLFSLDEWSEWKEIEGLFQAPVMKTRSVRHVVQDSGQTHETNILKCYDSGDGRKPETSCRDQSLNMLNTKISVTYPENNRRKMPPDKMRSIKEGLRNLLCANRKTPSILQGPSEKPPTLPVQTGNGTDTSTAATQDLAGDPEQSSLKRPTICYDCGKIFFFEGCLFRHQEMHRALKPYHCSACGEPFFSQTHLLRHQEIHPELRPYNCTECGKLFISQELLHRHQETHRLRKLYSSTDCGKIFLSQELLHRHQETHRAEKPHNCTECGKSFKTKARFHYHQSTHTAVKAFECSICGMCFIRKGLLTRHSRIHPGMKSTPDTVSTPNKDVKLTTRSNEETYEVLGQNKIQEMQHDTTFSCSKCEKKFVSRHFLKIHEENIHREMRKSLSKPKKKLLLKLKIVRRHVDSAGEQSASWQWTIVSGENAQGRDNP